ncbi:MAG: shikimate dehydrogenase [Clostridia bacterium]|nr:shikimate dehydrogenase [Clostridia bacterium]
MKYGLIGEHLGHSFSKEIHEKIGDYVYEIKEIEPDKVESFMLERDFLGINVTIPYKEKVIPMLDYIDDSAKKIGAVNTVVNRNGKLYGYNTDYSGMRALVLRVGAEIKGKKVLIIGTGGTSKTARAVVGDLGAKEIIFVSNIEVNGALSYEEVYKSHTDVDVIFNTSPVGMYPRNNACPIDLDNFPNLTALIDVVYNPIKTKLVREARKRGIKAEGGLYMLGAQAVYEYEHFSGNKATKELCDSVYNDIIKEKSNIVLIGMPASGKSTVGKRLAELTGKCFIDTDLEIVKTEGTEIPEIFATKGEAYFRNLEAKIVEEVSKLNGYVIATGGGAILREENRDNLKQNGKVYFLDRDLELLAPTSDRPLSSDRASIEKRYNERYDIYCQACDVRVDGNGTVDEVSELIYKEL